MLQNVSVQNQALLIWSGTASTPRDIRRHVNFAFTFEVTAPLAADTIFKVQAHDPSAADPCVAGPAYDVPEVPICQSPAFVPAATTQIVIPAGTPVGSICGAGIPCRPAAFISLAAVSGDTADVRAAVTLNGPMI